MNAQVFYAVNYGGNNMRFVQTDFVICQKWVNIINAKGVALSMKYQGSLIREGPLLHLWQANNYLQFGEVK